MPLLYLETNFILAVATGRLPEVHEVLGHVPAGVRLTLPGVCLMESLTAVAREHSAANEFSQRMQERIGRIRESGQLVEFQELRTRLEEGILLANRAADTVRARMSDAIDALTRRAVLLPLIRSQCGRA